MKAEKEAPRPGTNRNGARGTEGPATSQPNDTEEMQMTEAREVGMHDGVQMEEYLGQFGASASRLRMLRRSPAHCRYAMDHPKPSTPAMLLGVAADAAILEPDTFSGQYVRGPEGDGRTKAVREAREALGADHPHATILSPGDFDACLAMRDAVWAHPGARKLLQVDGRIQQTLVWEEEGEEDVVRCIGRPDRITNSGLLIDLKTTSDASPHGMFPRHLYEYGYVLQQVHYWTGLASLGVEIRAGLIIAVESSPPHAVVVYQPDLSARGAAASERYALLKTWETCIRTGVWPSYPDTIQSIGLPQWAVRQIEEIAA